MTDDEGYYLKGGFYTKSELREILERGAIRRLVDRFIKWAHYPDHLNRKDCWCEPVLDYENPETGNQVWVHNDIQ